MNDNPNDKYLNDKYLHIRSLEKYHPGYKDRELKWAKMYFNMVQGDPDCEMITSEIDFARLIKFIILELQAKRPIPLEPEYLKRKGFDIKKRPISLTINMLHNFVEVVTDCYGNQNGDVKTCVLDKDKEEDKEEDKEGGVSHSFLSEQLPIPAELDTEEVVAAWNEFKQHRKEIKKKMTQRAEKMMLKQLLDLSDGDPAKAVKILEQSMANGWQGIFELKGSNYGTNQQNNRRNAKAGGATTSADLERTFRKIFPEKG